MVVIPKCESAVATTEVMKLFDSIDAMIKTNTKALELSKQTEINSTKNGADVISRSCSGSMLASDTRVHLNTTV
jgi:hypothetical protein